MCLCCKVLCWWVDLHKCSSFKSYISCVIILTAQLRQEKKGWNNLKIYSTQTVFLNIDHNLHSEPLVQLSPMVFNIVWCTNILCAVMDWLCYMSGWDNLPFISCSMGFSAIAVFFMTKWTPVKVKFHLVLFINALYNTLSSVRALWSHFQHTARLSLSLCWPLQSRTKWVSKNRPGCGKACDESPPLLFLLSTLHQVECCRNCRELWLLFDHIMGVWPVTKWWQTWPTHSAARGYECMCVCVFPTHSATYLTRGRSQRVRVLRIHIGHLAFNS